MYMHIKTDSIDSVVELVQKAVSSPEPVNIQSNRDGDFFDVSILSLTSEPDVAT